MIHLAAFIVSCWIVWIFGTWAISYIVLGIGMVVWWIKENLATIIWTTNYILWPYILIDVVMRSLH